MRAIIYVKTFKRGACKSSRKIKMPNFVWNFADVTVKMSTGSMSSSSDMDVVKNAVPIQALPDVFFGDNSVIITIGSTEIDLNPREAVIGSLIREPVDEISGLWFGINPPCLLFSKSREELLGNLKVSHSTKWLARHTNTSVRQLEYNHDWTFTNTYWGKCSGFKSSHLTTRDLFDEEFLPQSKLTDTSLKILLFKELDFWEDELDDSGFSRMGIKMRFMEKFFLILMKCEVRVDDVLASRSIETRFYYEYNSGNLKREFKWIENGSELHRLGTAQSIEVG